MLQQIIALLDRAVDLGTTVQVETTDNMFQIYHDPNGQRAGYLTQYGHGNQVERKESNRNSHPGLYVIRRRHTFTNPEDIGTEGAVIGVLRIKESTDAYQANKMPLSIDREKQSVTVGNFRIRFRADLNSPTTARVIL